MRIYDPNPTTLNALRGSGIELIVGVLNDKVQSLTDPSAASSWVQTNILHYLPDVSFRYIAVGNEIRPGDAAAGAVLPAMKRVREALAAAGQQDKIKVTTAVDTTLVANVSRPSDGYFSCPDYINPIVDFLAATGAPILVNVYLYFAHVQKPKDVPLDYALFKSSEVRIQDGPYGYDNLFDAIVDTQYAALENAFGYVKNANKSRIKFVVPVISGWPSKPGGKKHPNQSGLPSESDDSAATPENAETYYKNLMAHVSKGTPRRPGQAIETYLFAMFDENLKTPEIEQNYGLFYPNKTPKYQLSFN